MCGWVDGWVILFDMLTFDFLLKPPQPVTGLFLLNSKPMLAQLAQLVQLAKLVQLAQFHKLFLSCLKKLAAM